MEIMTEKKTEKKRENRTSSSFILLLFLLLVLTGASIYVFQKYLFIVPADEFDLTQSYKPELKKKESEIASYDFSIFNSEKFDALEGRAWHEYDPASLMIGNPGPFSQE